MKNNLGKSKGNNKKGSQIIFALIAGLLLAPYANEAGVHVGGLFGRLFF